MKRFVKVGLALCALLMFWSSAHAVGLGKLTVLSALGQPLRAEIELLAVNKEDLADISVRIAGEPVFRQARISREKILDGVALSLVPGVDGTVTIKLASDTPIASAFLDVMLEVNWPTGRMVREYTLLFDPPRAPMPVQPVIIAMPVTTPAPAIQQAPAPVAAESKREIPVARDDGKRETAAAAPVPANPVQAESKPSGVSANAVVQPAPVAASKAAHYGPVRRGDNLYSIASRIQAESLSREQVMAALYLNNQDAFVGSNMNRLKTGEVLDLPDAESVHKQVSDQRGRHLVHQHYLEWQAQRDRAAAVAAPSADAQAATPASAGKIVPKSQAAETPQAAPRDMLKLSKGEPDVSGKRDAEVQARLQALDEDLAAKSAALKETQERVAKLEQIVRDLEHMQKAAPPVMPAPAVVPPAPLPAPVSPEPKTLKDWLTDPLVLGGAAIAVLAALLLWMALAARRRLNAMKAMKMAAPAAAPAAAPVAAPFELQFHDPEPEPAPAFAFEPEPVEEFLPEPEPQASEPEPEPEPEVDPIAEADLYLSYGRDAHAEAILREALYRDPSRHDVALKLLEIFAARPNKKSFEEFARGLLSRLVGPDTPEWRKAAEMGRSIDPENPLYGGAPAAAPVAEHVLEVPPEASVDDLGMDFEPVVDLTEEFDQPDVQPDTPEPDDGLDFVAESALNESIDETGLPDLDDLTLMLDQAPAEEETPPPLDDDAPGALPELDLSAIDLELAAADAPAVEEDLDDDSPTGQISMELWEEVHTKMDLARAYIEMGDREGAKEILDEVDKEGDSRQQRKARELMASLT